MARAKSTVIEATKDYLTHLANEGRDFFAKGMLDLGGPRVLTGFELSNGTTTIVQGTGAVAPTVSIGIDRGLAYVGNGYVFELAAANPDQPLSTFPVLGVGQSCIMYYMATLYVDGSGVFHPNGAIVYGPVATTASVRGPNDAEIAAGVTSWGTNFSYTPVYPIRWALIGSSQVDRTADTAATQTTKNLVREPGLNL